MNLINKLIVEEIINKKDADLYEYSFNILKSYIFFIIIIVIANIFTKKFETTIVFLIIFISLRKYCGGFHFNRKSTCFIFSIILTLLVPIISSQILISNQYIILLLQLFISVILIFFPIIEIPQKNLSYIEKKYYKLRSIKILIILFMINCVCLLFDFYKISIIFLISILITFLSVLFGYLKYMHISR